MNPWCFVSEDDSLAREWAELLSAQPMVAFDACFAHAVFAALQPNVSVAVRAGSDAFHLGPLSLDEALALRFFTSPSYKDFVLAFQRAWMQCNKDGEKHSFFSTQGVVPDTDNQHACTCSFAEAMQPFLPYFKLLSSVLSKCSTHGERHLSEEACSFVNIAVSAVNFVCETTRHSSIAPSIEQSSHVVASFAPRAVYVWGALCGQGAGPLQEDAIQGDVHARARADPAQEAAASGADVRDSTITPLATDEQRAPNEQHAPPSLSPHAPPPSSPSAFSRPSESAAPSTLDPTAQDAPPPPASSKAATLSSFFPPTHMVLQVPVSLLVDISVFTPTPGASCWVLPPDQVLQVKRMLHLAQPSMMFDMGASSNNSTLLGATGAAACTRGWQWELESVATPTATPTTTTTAATTRAASVITAPPPNMLVSSCEGTPRTMFSPVQGSPSCQVMPRSHGSPPAVLIIGGETTNTQRGVIGQHEEAPTGIQSAAAATGTAVMEGAHAGHTVFVTETLETDDEQDRSGVGEDKETAELRRFSLAAEKLCNIVSPTRCWAQAAAVVSNALMPHSPLMLIRRVLVPSSTVSNNTPSASTATAANSNTPCTSSTAAHSNNNLHDSSCCSTDSTDARSGSGLPRTPRGNCSACVGDLYTLACSLGDEEDERAALPDGRTFTKRELFLEALHQDPRYAPVYISLAMTLEAEETVRLKDGRSVSQTDLFVLALKYDPDNTWIYINLAAALSGDDSVVLHHGLRVDKQGLYVEALRCDADCCVAYNNLGSLLGPSGTVTLRDGRTLDERRLYLEALRCDPHYASAYNNLGVALAGNETVTLLDGRRLGKRDLYLEALRCDPDWALAYSNLATTLGPEDAVVLADGRRLETLDVYMEALRCDPLCALTYCNLGSILASGETVTTSDGRVWNKQQLLVESLRLNPRCGLAYNNLALTLRAEEQVVLADGRTLSQRDLYLEALEWDPACAFAYCNLGTTLAGQEVIVLRNGQVLNERQLYVEALRCDPNHAHAYVNLAQTMDEHEKVHLRDGRRLSRLECYAEALRCNPDDAETCVCLANALSPGESIRIDQDRLLSQSQLYKEALLCNPDHADAYVYLACTLRNSSDCVMLADGRLMTQRQLFSEALRCDPECAFARTMVGDTLSLGGLSMETDLSSQSLTSISLRLALDPLDSSSPSPVTIAHH